MPQTSRESFLTSSENDGIAMVDYSSLHQERTLDEALMESFPASDPVAICFGYVRRHILPTVQASDR